MKKKIIISSALLMTSFLSMIAADKWPVTLTTLDGLPGKKSGNIYQYTSPLLNVDQATATLRLTVVSTNTVDGLVSNSNDGLSAGWGVGFPYFALSELRILDVQGNNVAFTATTNAREYSEGEIAGLNDGLSSTYFHSVWSSEGNCPQAYHYVDIALSKPLSSFTISWDTRQDYTKYFPTYVGITPGTLYLPYGEMDMSIGEQITSPSQLAEPGALFLIKGNVEPYEFSETRSFEGGGYFHSPYGAATIPSADDLVYLIPMGNNNTYKVRWLANGRYLGKCDGSAWIHSVTKESEAGVIKFIPNNSVPGDFTLKMDGYLDSDKKEYVIVQDAIIKMRTIAQGTTISRPTAENFTLFKVGANGNAVKPKLQSAIDEALRRIDAYGGKTQDDAGEFDALLSSIDVAKSLISSTVSEASEIIATLLKVENATANYAALRVFYFTDMIESILSDDNIDYSSPPNWVSGTFPHDARLALEKAMDAALEAFDKYTSLGDVDLTLGVVEAAIADFWASKIDKLTTLPIRMNDKVNGMPGEKNSNSWTWASPVVYLAQETDVIRITIFATNSGASFNGYAFPTLSELMILDASGNQLMLDAKSFTTNSLATGDGQGLAALCDGDASTYYHAAYSNSHEIVPNSYVYLEVTLPRKVSAFRYKQIGRNNGGNTPVDVVFGKGGVAVLPDDVAAPDSWNAQFGEKVTSLAEIKDDGFYAIYGNLGADPVHGWGGKGTFYKNNKSAPFSSYCAFVFENAGDGRYYIKSLYDNKYWALSHTSGSGVEPTYLRENAAPFSITPSNNNGLPNAYRLSYPHESDPHRAYVYQSWEDYVGSYEVSSDFSDDDKDGESEWYIYHITMDAPYHYWLLSTVGASMEMGLIESPDPGFYSNLGLFPAAFEAAQNALANNDLSNAKALVFSLNDAIHSLSGVEKNPILEGKTYLLESSYAEFFNKQGINKAIYVEESDGGYTPLWGDVVKNDSLFWFVLEKSNEHARLSQLVDEGKITSQDANSAFFLKSVKSNNYLGLISGNNMPVEMVDEPSTYIVKSLNAGRFNIRNPVDVGYNIHANAHSNGGGKGGDLVYWISSAEPSQWYLRGVNTTSVGGDVDAETGEVVSVKYYSISGVASSLPQKGVNVEQTLYSNGEVRTKKIYIK